ncbi:hypothetical protein [Streptomyces anulatus]|uniref:hypothetical protein n=1 Tax=Streptomyces anulatus TaxID=1892 RepID=UPI00331A89FD
MRIAPTAFAIALGALLVGVTTSSDVSQTVTDHAATPNLSAVMTLHPTEDDHGNG